MFQFLACRQFALGRLTRIPGQGIQASGLPDVWPEKQDRPYRTGCDRKLRLCTIFDPDDYDFDRKLRSCMNYSYIIGIFCRKPDKSGNVPANTDKLTISFISDSLRFTG